MALPQASNQATILVVDDEPALREALYYMLRREGYRVELAETGVEALRAVRREQPDAVVLDVMLPGIDGLQVCRTLRTESTVPILLLSAKGEEIDRVVGLEIGADDYLTKPFAMRELLARIKAMLRRAEMVKPATLHSLSAPVAQPAVTIADAGDLASSVPTETPVVVGPLIVDRARRQASIAGRLLSLRPKEFDLLYFLAKNPGVVHSREVLLRRVWGYDFPIGTRTVDVHMRWLRLKIEGDPADPQLLQTVRGAGYRLAQQFE